MKLQFSPLYFPFYSSLQFPLFLTCHSASHRFGDNLHFLSAFLQSSACPCLVSLQSLWVQIIWHNFSHLGVRYSPRLIFWARFTAGRGRPSWQFIPRSLGRGKRLSLAFTGHLNLRQRKRVTSPVICDSPITAYHWAYKDKRRNKTKICRNLKGKKVEKSKFSTCQKRRFF